MRQRSLQNLQVGYSVTLASFWVIQSVTSRTICAAPRARPGNTVTSSGLSWRPRQREEGHFRHILSPVCQTWTNSSERVHLVLDFLQLGCTWPPLSAPNVLSEACPDHSSNVLKGQVVCVIPHPAEALASFTSSSPVSQLFQWQLACYIRGEGMQMFLVQQLVCNIKLQRMDAGVTCWCFQMTSNVIPCFIT